MGPTNIFYLAIVFLVMILWIDKSNADCCAPLPKQLKNRYKISYTATQPLQDKHISTSIIYLPNNINIQMFTTGFKKN